MINIALVCVLMGIVVFLCEILTRREFMRAAPLLLDFWTAAGLIKLSGLPNWNSIVTAIVFILIRKSTMISLKSRKQFRHI